MAGDFATDDAVLALVRAIDAKATELRSWLDLPGTLHAAVASVGADPDSVVVTTLRWASDWHLELDGRDVVLSHFPRMPPRQAPHEVQEGWRTALAYSKSAPLRARLADLLSVCGGAAVPALAAAAIEAYLEIAVARGWSESDRAMSLRRGLSLLRYNPDGAEEKAARLGAALLDSARRTIRSDSLNCIFCIEGIATRKTGDNGSEAGVLVNELLEMEASPWIQNRIAALATSLGVLTSKQAAAHRVHVLLKFAENVDAFLAQGAITEAIEIATEAGLSELRHQARLALQSRAREPIPWQKIGATATLPSELRSVEIERISCGASPEEGFLRWAHSFALSEDPKVRDAAAEAEAAEPSLLNSITQVVYGADNLPRKTVKSREDRVKYLSARGQRIYQNFAGIILADALERIVGRFPLPEMRNRVGQALTDLGVPSSVSLDRLLHSVELFAKQDFIAAITICSVSIEGAVRDVVLQHDVPAYKLERGELQGTYVALDKLFDILDSKGFDPVWSDSARFFLLGGFGMNIRNDIAHGFEPQIPAREGASIAIRLMLLFLLMTDPITPRSPTDESPGEDGALAPPAAGAAT